MRLISMRRMLNRYLEFTRSRLSPEPQLEIFNHLKDEMSPRSAVIVPLYIYPLDAESWEPLHDS